MLECVFSTTTCPLAKAMPQGVSLMCTGFVFIWLILLPFGLINGPGGMTANFSVLVIMAVASMLLLGVDEMASQMEKPYRMLPLDDIYNSEERNMNNLLGELHALRISGNASKSKSNKGPPVSVRAKSYTAVPMMTDFGVDDSQEEHMVERSA